MNKPGPIERIRILGVPVDVVDMSGAIAFVDMRIKTKQAPGYIVAINPEKVMVIRKDAFLQGFVEKASLLITDGIGVLIAGRFLLRKKMVRVTGVDLMEKLCELAEQKKYSIFLYGAKEEVNKEASEVLQCRFPDLRIAGRCNGYVDDTSMQELIKKINSVKPDILFVALGSPRQEKWIRTYLDGLDVGVCQGIGGTLDAITGHVKRAPRFFQNAGLEWLYRLAKQPARIGRQLNLVKFMWEVLKEKTRKNKYLAGN